MQASKFDPAECSPRAAGAGPLAVAHLGAACALAFLITTLPVMGQQGWSEEFDRPGLPLGEIWAVEQYQGELFAGGIGFFEADGHTFGAVARFDGTHWQPMGSGIKNGSVLCMAEFQGELVVAGQFGSAGGKQASSIARWNGTSWNNLGASGLWNVWALAEYNGELYAGGEFTSAGGQPAGRIARWDGTQWHTVGTGVDGPLEPVVRGLKVGPDSRLYACGEFTSAGGQPAHNIAAWDGSSWSPVGAGFPGPLNAKVYALEWYQGELYAGGNFDLVPGGSNMEKIAVWDGTSWSAAAVITDHFKVAVVYALQTFGTDLYAGGAFKNVDGIPFEGAKRCARFDGTQWTSPGGVVDNGLNSAILDFTVLGGKLVAGGQFVIAGVDHSPGKAVVTDSVASFDGTAWEGVGTGLGFNFWVRGAVLWNDDIVATGGKFSTAGSHWVNGPALFDGTDWVGLGNFSELSGGVDTAIVFQGDLVVAGDFVSVDGKTVNDVARFDGTKWTALGKIPLCCGVDALAVYKGQLYAGGLGGVLRWTGAKWVSFAPQIFGSIQTMYVHKKVLYIGGSMNSFGNLVSWNGTVQQIVGGGTDGIVYAFESFGGDLLVGGAFTQAGGAPVSRLARWDGSSFSTFPGINSGQVTALTVFQGELYASGDVLFQSGAKKYLTRWDGGAWQAVGGGLDAHAWTLLADDAGGHLYAAGGFRHAGGKPSSHFARWDTEPMPVGTPFCFGDGSGVSCPCGNDDLAGGVGCANSTGWGAKLSGSGGTSVNLDQRVLTGTGLPPSKFNVLFMGASSAAAVPMADGLRCIDGSLQRFFVNQSDATGTTVYTGVVSYANANFPLGFQIASGSTWHFQDWYRDPAGP
ncbi:MAG: hypothetical protein V3T22_10150, partial [Planctomycetota bacterium]